MAHAQRGMRRGCGNPVKRRRCGHPATRKRGGRRAQRNLMIFNGLGHRGPHADGTKKCGKHRGNGPTRRGPPWPRRRRQGTQRKSLCFPGILDMVRAEAILNWQHRPTDRPAPRFPREEHKMPGKHRVSAQPVNRPSRGGRRQRRTAQKWHQGVDTPSARRSAQSRGRGGPCL